MQKLIEFLIGKRHWFLFILCEVISLTCVFRYNAYQQNVFFSSANVVSGRFLSIANSMVSYVNLRDENRNLIKHSEQLELENLYLKMQLESLKANMLPYDYIMTDSTVDAYEYISADVVNNSVSHLLNYITINKGYKDGIRPEMGVISPRGLVGKVTTVNDRFAVIIPLLNPTWKLSCKLLNGDYNGFLAWDGRDPQVANLEELPTHTAYQEGDTVVTTGYSGVFPRGLLIGTVLKSDDFRNSGNSVLKVKLTTDFRRLSTVRVVKNNYQQEQWEVEREASKND